MAHQFNKIWMVAISSTIVLGDTSLILPGLANASVNLPKLAEQPSPRPLPSPVKTPSPNPFKTLSPKELVDEVWQIIDSSYIDSTFNQQDWKAVRQRYINRPYNSFEEAYQAINEMLKLLGDPLTRFIDPIAFKNMQIRSDSDVAGIGLQLAKDEKTQKITVTTPIDDGPAWKAGVFEEDILAKIDGKSTEGIDVNTAVNWLRGKPGTFVNLMILREGKPLEFRIQRAKVEIHPVRYKVQETTIGRVGYMRFVQFSSTATSEMKAAIERLEAQNVKGYILDLRSNSGGLLYVAVEVTRLWLPRGIIVTAVRRQGEIDQERANNRALTNKPLVVLVDGTSASASEIMAAALQENQRAVLVGTRTYGNNSIQSVRSLGYFENNSGIAVTIAKWLTPKGRDINKVGIEPDVTVKLTEKQQRELRRDRDKTGTSADLQYAKALEILTQQLGKAR